MSNICHKVFVSFLFAFCHLDGSAVESSIVNVDSPHPGLLSSPRVTEFGDWGEFEYCEEGTYVIGMRLKTEPNQGCGDDAALNGISFMCGVIGETQQVLHSPERQLQSLTGIWGDWGASYECHNSYAVGFQLRSEEFQHDNDDSAANNLRIFCSNSMTYLEGSGLDWGDWTEPQRCPVGWAMCGLRTQVQSSQGGNIDDTALNNLDVQCCELNFIQEDEKVDRNSLENDEAITKLVSLLKFGTAEDAEFVFSRIIAEKRRQLSQ